MRQRLVEWRAAVRGALPFLLIAGIVAALLGEAWLRAPFLAPRLEYRFDPELSVAWQPNQRGVLFMGTDGRPSPPATINSLGFRGDEPPMDRQLVFAVGDSQSFGSGVRDDEVWTSQLSRAFRQSPALKQFDVVNGSMAGTGPADHAVLVERALRALPVRALVIWVSIEDRNFVGAPRGAEAVHARQEYDLRNRVRAVTKFMPYTLDKARAQVPDLRAAVHPLAVWSRGQKSGLPDSTADQMWSTFGADWTRIAEMARGRNMPVLFLVHDPEDMPSNARLFQLLTERLGDTAHGITVARVGSRDFGLDAIPAQRREQNYIDRYTVYAALRDLHANARGHCVVARFALPLVTSMISPATASSAPEPSAGIVCN